MVEVGRSNGKLISGISSTSYGEAYMIKSKMISNKSKVTIKTITNRKTTIPNKKDR